MDKKKIVSIEDRIPKLKEERKKKANRRLIFYLSILFLLISIIVYLQSPLSHIRSIQIEGNILVSEEEVIKRSGISTDMNIWGISKPEIEQKLIDELVIIESANVHRSLPWTVKIEVQEYARVGYVEDDYFYPVLGTGQILEQLKQERYYGDAPVLVNFTEDEYLHRMASELEQLPNSILNLISEVHWNPTEKNKNKILLYMSDGYTVDSTIRNFSDNMSVYPSIVSQLDPENKGTIHLGAGAYFRSESEEAAESDEKDENDEPESEHSS